MTADQAKQVLIAGYVYGKELTDAQRQRFAKIAGTDLQGNDLEDDDEELTESTDNSQEESAEQDYRFGGQRKNKLPKNFTSKNIQSSLNVLMLRNHLIFGPEGKHNIYMPGLKKQKGGIPMYPTGGGTQMYDPNNPMPIVTHGANGTGHDRSIMYATNNMPQMTVFPSINPAGAYPPQQLGMIPQPAYQPAMSNMQQQGYTIYGNNGQPIPIKGKAPLPAYMQGKKKGGEPEAYPQQPTDQQFFSPTFIPHGPRAFYEFGGANPPAFPQQPPFNIFMTNAPWHPTYNHGGQPCFQCGGGYMQDGGTPPPVSNSSFTPGTSGDPNYYGNKQSPPAPVTNPANPNQQATWFYNQQGVPAFRKTEAGDYIWRTVNQPTTPVTSKAYGGPAGTFMHDDQFAGGGEKWIQKANKHMKAEGTKGAFTEYCGGHVTSVCIERGLKSSDPTTRKRAAFAKAMRHIAHKQFGGDAPQGFDTNNIVDSKKDYFKKYIGKNTMTAWADEEAMNLADMHDHMMAAYGMQVPDQMNYQNMAQAQMLQNNIDEGSVQSGQDMHNLFGAGLNLSAHTNPYYETIQKAFGGSYDSGGGLDNIPRGTTFGQLGNYTNNNWYGQMVNPYGVSQYGVAPNLIPMNYQPYYKFRTNQAPGPNSFLPPGFNPEGAKNFNYDYRGRFFGQGPRRVKMSWDEYNPTNGQQQQQPNPQGSNTQTQQNSDGNQIIPGTGGMSKNALMVNNYALNSPGMPGYDVTAQQWAQQNPNQNYPLPYVGGSNYYQAPGAQYSMYPEQPNPGVPPTTMPGMKQGGVYELNQDQIQQIMDAGGEIEYID